MAVKPFEVDHIGYLIVIISFHSFFAGFFFNKQFQVNKEPVFTLLEIK